MSRTTLWTAGWTTDAGRLRLDEPTSQEIAENAKTLCAYYNESHNAAMMANSGPMSAEDVIAYYLQATDDGGRPVLLYRDQQLAGDADLRHLTPTAAECAILIGERAEQGRGLGTRFAIMLHALAFGPLALEHLYVSIVPANIGSQRLFAKLGYTPDDSVLARGFADLDSDLTFSLPRAVFFAKHAPILKEISFTPR